MPRAKRVDPRKMAKARRAYDRATRAARVAERRYIADLGGLFVEINGIALRYLGPAMQAAAERGDALKGLGGRGPENPKSAMARLRKSLQKQIDDRTTATSGRMVEAVDAASIAYAELIGFRPIDISRALGEVYTETVNRNADLVRSALGDYGDQVASIFTDPKNFGRRVEDLAALVEERGQVAQSRAELIARDQVLKTLGALNEVRQTSAGITSYVWSTSRDGVVRPEHVEREGVIFSWDGPPEDGHPGEPIQCRCAAVPVLDEAAGLFGGVGDRPTSIAESAP